MCIPTGPLPCVFPVSVTLVDLLLSLIG
uniref:Uncharacterized protein n=1 Tax=Anguilla anguilla TaxID=7936 RepID=A0A0E9RFM9_ANGAN